MLQLAVVVGSIVAVFIAITPQGRAGFETALFVLDILEAPYSPRALAGPEVVRQQVSYETARGMSIAEVYRIADDEPRPAVVLSIGVSEEGFDHPNAVILGNAMARAGIVVMYHWPMEMSLQNNLDPQEIDNIVSAFLYLEAQEYVDAERVGLGGFCVGGSFALVAASDHRIRDRVELVNVFGPYFDGREIVFQAVANAAVYRQQRIPWEPDPATTMVLRNELLEAVAGTPDAVVLDGSEWMDGIEKPRDFSTLSPTGQAVRGLLSGASYEEAVSLYNTLPLKFRKELDSVSPSSVVREIRARVLILHTRSDTVIPVAESYRLEESLQGRVDVRFTEVVDFDHTVPLQGGVFTLLKQAAQLYLHMYEIIRVAS